ncbi:hypothetical protein D3272_22725 [Lichenibacterium ramalinae]|uniref:Uncharacterized protein n=2 Tax=Lichenibacterium ramalinae TaxID=2316527 RepID=A0A4Q2RB57_9HYPH|nr:hypothetical protein D3272_22725 [Lichenibacterium ramalinae]
MIAEGDISLTRAEYDLLIRGHTWIRSVDPYASLSRGWSGIFVDMLEALDLAMTEIAVERPGSHVRVIEFTTKSKFGSMRVYCGLAGVSGPPDGVWRLLRAIIDRAEERSALTCERCGAPGRLREVDEWLMTLCDAHATLEERP